MPKITELFAFVCEESPGDEGVMGATMNIPGVGPSFTPLVGADMKRIESLRPIAEQIKAMSGKEYKILRFTLADQVK
jgi:hypothetical protein